MLNTLAHTHEVQTYLESRHPQNPEYQALRVELEALRASEENEIVVDPKLLLEARRDQRRTAEAAADRRARPRRRIRRRLWRDAGYAFGKSETYIPELVPVIKEVQKRAGLKPDGVVGPRTVASLAGTSKADRIDKVRVRAGATALAAVRSRQPARLHQRAGLHRQLTSKAARRS